MEKTVTVNGTDYTFTNERMAFRYTAEEKMAVVPLEATNDTDGIEYNPKNRKVEVDIQAMMTAESFSVDEIAAVKKFFKGCFASAINLTIADITEDPF